MKYRLLWAAPNAFHILPQTQHTSTGFWAGGYVTSSQIITLTMLVSNKGLLIPCAIVATLKALHAEPTLH